MKTDALNRFKEEMKNRGLFRKIQVCVNLIPPPDAVRVDLQCLHKAAAKEALFMYARKHEDFADLMVEAAMDHLMDSVLTDDLFTPVAGFTPTEEEQVNMDRAKATAEALTGLLDFLKHI